MRSSGLAYLRTNIPKSPPNVAAHLAQPDFARRIMVGIRHDDYGVVLPMSPAAQARDEVASKNDGSRNRPGQIPKPTRADIGLSDQEIKEAREIRNAERRQTRYRSPGC